MKPLLRFSSFAAVLLCAACAAQPDGSAGAARGDPAQGVLAAAGTASPDAPMVPQSRALYLRLVRALEIQGKNHAALAYLDDYDGKYPHDPQAALLRAGALLAVGEADKAAKVYRALLGGALAPAAHNGLGQVAATRGDWPAAQREFHAAIALDPVDANFLNNYGYAALKTGDLADAEFRLRQAAELAPDNGEIRDNLILCLHLAGKAAAARALIDARPPDRRQAIETALAEWRPAQARVRKASAP